MQIRSLTPWRYHHPRRLRIRRRRDPFTEIRHDFDSFFEGLAPSLSKSSLVLEREFTPRINVIENDAEFVVTAELPGLEEEDIEIRLERDVLTIKGEGVATGKAMMNTEEILEKDSGICVDIERVFMKKGTYPPIWKKH